MSTTIPTAPTRSHGASRALSACYATAILGVIAIAVTGAAGLLLLVLNPAAGSDTESALGVIAAASGLSSGLLFVSAVVIAQVFGLWTRFSSHLRIAATTLLVAVLLLGFVRQLV